MAEGFVDAHFCGVASSFDREVARLGGGAALCVYHRGAKVVDIWGGRRNAAGDPWARDTLSLSFSTTKGVTATALHRLVDRGLADYDDPVVRYWPEFGGGVKRAITLRQVLSHQAGLSHVRRMVDRADRLLDWDYMVGALERAKPRFRPGSASGYHAFTFGWLVGELVQRISGASFGDVVRQEVCDPLQLDGVFIGAGGEETLRAAELLRPSYSPLDLEWLTPGFSRVGRWGRALGLSHELGSIADALLLPQARDLFWHPRLHDVPIPAANGLFSARSLAKLYAAWAGGGRLGGVRLLSERTVERATRVHVRSRDRVLMFQPGWRLGFHGAFTTRGRLPGGFGHFGFGGSGAWADPERELSMAYVNNEIGGGPLGSLPLYRLGASVLDSADRLGAVAA